MMPDFTTLRAALLQELDRALESVDSGTVDQFRALLRDAPHIFIAGQGRSGLAMRAFAMRLMHLGLPVYVLGDVTTPAIAAGDLLVIGSGSGRTASLVQHAMRAAELGADVALITSATDSAMHAPATCVLHLAASTPKLGIESAPDGSIQPMAALFEQTLLLLLDLVIVQLMHELGQTAERMFTRHANLE